LGVRCATVLLAVAAVAAPVRPAASAPGAAALRASGLDHYYNLEYDAAIADFHQLVALQPDSAAAWNHLSQAILYREMYRIGALQSQLYGHGDPFLQQRLLPPDPAEVKAFDDANQKALSLSESAVAHQPNDAHAHYDEGVAYALRGTLEFSVQSSYFSALGDAKRARREAESASRLDPAFVDPKLILGTHNYIAGSLPWTARIFSSLIGYSGDKELGRSQVEFVSTHGENSQTDATVLLVVMDRRDGLNQQAASLLRGLVVRYPRNVLLAVEEAEAWEAAGSHDQALAAYRAVVAHAAGHAPGYQRAPLDKVWYDLGNIERLYSHWQLAARDYEQIESLPHPRTRYLQAGSLAAGEVELRAGDPLEAQKQFTRCRDIDPHSPAGEAAIRELAHQ